MDWRYHPQEIAWRSLPGSAHTSPEALALALQAHRSTGWVRHGGTFEASAGGSVGASRNAGLHAVLVANGLHTLLSQEGHPDLPLQRSLLRSCDLALVEGAVDGSCPLVVELDGEGGGLEKLLPRDLARVVALVGPMAPRTGLPPGGIPRFPAEALADLAEHLLDLLETRGRERPLAGVLLPGPEASIEAEASAARVLQAHCSRVVRVAADDPRLPDIETIPPSHPGWGDAGRILTAFEAFPDATLLALDAAPEHATRVERLLAERDPLGAATAFRTPDTHMPDPGASLWEPRSRETLAAMLASGTSCIRRTLVQAGTKLLSATAG